MYSSLVVICVMLLLLLQLHALLELNHVNKWHRMAATKKWAQEEGISMWEAGQCLDSELFLNEYPRWRADGPQCPCILQRMFAYAKEAGQKEQEWVTHQGCQHPVSRAMAKVKTLAIQIVGLRTTREEIQGIYNEVYQQKRLPGPPTIWARVDGSPWPGNLCFFGRADTAEVGYHQARRRSTGSHCTYSVA